MQFKNFVGNLAGWQPCDAARYARIYEQFGGSVCCHPDVLQFLSCEQNLTLRYFALKEGDDDAGACFPLTGSAACNTGSILWFLMMCYSRCAPVNAATCQ
ncbi:hypothetical protein VWV82_003167 [Cronobacter malonaticus]|nr:hypothetical protein [Cronobacter malonaticus]KIU58805.1 hypothetical protein CRSA0334_19125 [Cronobacter malonaticus ENBT0334]